MLEWLKQAIPWGALSYAFGFIMGLFSSAGLPDSSLPGRPLEGFGLSEILSAFVIVGVISWARPPISWLAVILFELGLLTIPGYRVSFHTDSLYPYGTAFTMTAPVFVAALLGAAGGAWLGMKKVAPSFSYKRDEILISIIVGFTVGMVNGALPHLLPEADWGKLLISVLLLPLDIIVVALSFKWGLLGAAVGGATAWLLVRVNPRPWVLYSAVLVATSLAVGGPIGWGWWWGFRVSEVSFRAESSDYAGPCPVTLKFVARITVKGGSGVVHYRIPRGEQGDHAKESIRFESSGTREVTTDMTLAKASRFGRPSRESGSLQLYILEPHEEEVKAPYRIKCTSWGKPDR